MKRRRKVHKRVFEPGTRRAMLATKNGTACNTKAPPSRMVDSWLEVTCDRCFASGYCP